MARTHYKPEQRVLKGKSMTHDSDDHGSERETMHYSFCETVHAASKSKWHIRELTEGGRKFIGSADTPALCGVEVSWDVEVAISFSTLKYCCPLCRRAYGVIEVLNSNPGEQ